MKKIGMEAHPVTGQLSLHLAAILGEPTGLGK
jgi:hypothetical protein